MAPIRILLPGQKSLCRNKPARRCQTCESSQIVGSAGRKDFKLEVGRKLGADFAINVLNDDLVQKIMDLTDGKGPHVVIEATGSADMLIKSIDLIRSNGIISVVAFYEKLIEKFDVDSFVMKNAKLVAVAGSPKLGPVILDMMKCGKINLLPLITHRYSLERVVNALDEMKVQNDARIKVMLEVHGVS
jgi:threonine dehydrogenase-like Zn-dependent dehydrogenase